MTRSRRPRMLARLIACAALFASLSSAAHADGIEHQAYQFLSGAGAIIYGAAGVGLPLVLDGKAGKNNALRTLDSAVTNLALTEGLKALFKEKRPNSNEHDSFPSEHATISFGIASVAGALHPKQAPYWYAGATLISASRVGLHEHTVGDVMAGAAIGYGVGRAEMSSPRGLLLFPFIDPSRHSYGLAMSGRF